MHRKAMKQLIRHGSQSSSIGAQANQLSRNRAQLHLTIPDSGFTHRVGLAQVSNNAGHVQLLPQKGGVFIAGINCAHHQQAVGKIRGRGLLELPQGLFCRWLAFKFELRRAQQGVQRGGDAGFAETVARAQHPCSFEQGGDGNEQRLLPAQARIQQRLHAGGLRGIVLDQPAHYDVGVQRGHQALPVC